MFGELLVEYKRFIKKEAGLTEETIKSYMLDIGLYLEYLELINIYDINKVNKSLLSNYLIDLEKQDLAASTISRRLSSIKSFKGFLINEGYIKRDPSIGLKGPRVEKSFPNILTVDEVENLMSQPKLDKISGLRDRAMLELIYSTGIEVKELLDLDIEDVDLDLLLIRVKGREDRVIPMGSYAKEYIGLYLEKREGLEQDSPLFLNNRGNRLSRQGLWKNIKKYQEASSIDKEITPKMLRQSFAVHMLENGADLNIVQKMLGHSDLGTSQIYASRSTGDSIRSVYRKTHPRA